MTRDDEIFGEAIALPPAARAEFAERACDGDAALHARLIALLANYEQAQRYFESPLVPAAAPLADENPGDALGLPAVLSAVDSVKAEGSAKAGRYTLIEKIGEGGCGVVWRAEQREPVRREVALKVIKLGMDTREVITRFAVERQALAMMEHPNIAKVLDAGTTERGRPYFVMELVRGLPITRYCEENRLTLRPRIELFIAVCDAVQHAHQKGIIHRDLKPSNILVATGSTRTSTLSLATPKVIDFGIAKATQGKLTDATLTGVRQMIGTPAYMSPEQMEPGSSDIDTRSDIYSLGVLLYELLTGEMPFDRKTTRSVEEFLKHVRSADPVRPSTRRRGQANGSGVTESLHRDLDWIVMRCLEKDRARRYESASALALDLQRHLRHEPVAARPPSTAYLLGRMIRRHRVVFAAAGVVAVVLVAAVIVSTWQAVRATRAEEVARRGEQEQSSLRRRAEAQELAARRRAYGADMRVLQQALSVDKLGLARETLDRQRPQPGQVDLRGWEWRYLWQFCQGEAESILCQKPRTVNFLSASPDGQWLAAGESGSGVVSLWHLPTRTETTVPRHGGFCCSSFSPRAPLLAFAGMAAGAQPGTPVVRLWHLIERRVVGEMSPATECAGMVFSRDGEVLVTCGTGRNNEIALWRVSDGRKLAAWPAPTEGRASHTAFAATADLKLAAYTSIPSSQIRVIDLATGATRWTAEAAQERVLSLAFSPDGRTLASGAGWAERPIRLWDVATGREIGRLEGQRGFTRGLAFSRDGGRLVSASGDQTVRVWDVAERRLLRTLRGHSHEVNAVAFLADERIASACSDGAIMLWDHHAVRAKGAFATLPKAVVTWAFAPQERSVITVDREGRVELWSGEGFGERQTRLELARPQRPVGLSTWALRRRYLFAPDRPLLALGFSNGQVRVWDWERGVMVGEFKAGSEFVEPHAFLSGGATLAVKTGNRLVEWDWAGGRELRGCPIPPDTAAIGFSPDGRSGLLAAGRVLAVTISSFDLAAGTSARVDRTGGGPIFSPDGKLVAVAGPGNAVSLWDARNYTDVARLSGFTIAPEAGAFSPDGQRLAAASGGMDALKLWDVLSHENVLTLEAEGSLFWQTAFSRGGNVLGMANSHSDIVHLWSAPTLSEIEAVEKTERLP